MSGLDEKGLADAVKAHNDAYWTVTNDSEGERKRMEKAISAYLSAVGQKAGTVEVKRDSHNESNGVE